MILGRQFPLTRSHISQLVKANARVHLLLAQKNEGPSTTSARIGNGAGVRHTNVEQNHSGKGIWRRSHDPPITTGDTLRDATG